MSSTVALAVVGAIIVGFIITWAWEAWAEKAVHTPDGPRCTLCGTGGDLTVRIFDCETEWAQQVHAGCAAALATFRLELAELENGNR